MIKPLKITVNASSKYDVLIGKNLIKDSGEILSGLVSKCKVAIITDDVVDKLYSSIVTTSLETAGFKVVKFVFKNGEQSKNIDTYAQILSFLATNELTRTDCVLALGGGVVGDMAGFVSATYLRGIKYVQVPTTLLAQIDSSVGGKTAIDLKEGKNLVGAFYQPQVVICDVDTLNSLPKAVFDDGMGEVAKYVVLDKLIYEHVTHDGSLEKLIALLVDYKRRIVEEDEFEGGKRRLLNFGHTIAHAIEKLSDYKTSHGSAVATGVKVILNLSKKHRFIDSETYENLSSATDKCVKAQELKYDIEQVAKACFNDKKRSGNTVNLVMAYGIGDARDVKVEVDKLKEFLS